MKFRPIIFYFLICGIIIGQLYQNPTRVFNTPKTQFDHSILTSAIYHNTREGYYRNPGFGTSFGYNKSGAVMEGTSITLRIRTTHGDATDVYLIVQGKYPIFSDNISMSIYETKDGYDYWEGIFPAQSEPNECSYYFEIVDGTSKIYYVDDVITDNLGGIGITSASAINPFPIIIYNSDFQTPLWHRNLTVGYQIFIDRFFNGEPSNDAWGNGSTGDVLWYGWDKSGNGVKDPTENSIYATNRSWNYDTPGLYDFYGGDLQGVLDKIDYLKNEMNIEMIWFNPFMESPDNHGYSVDNYYAVDPNFGILQDRIGGRVINNVTGGLNFFSNFASILEDKGIKIIADMVLNHVSAQSIYFQRFENSNVQDHPTGFDVEDIYPAINGAYENSSSNYSNWFHFNTFNHDYDKFDGQYDNIPVLKYDQTDEIEQELISGENSVFTFWSNLGVDGFRLDVNQDYQDGQGARHINQIIRNKIKSENEDTLIIGEVWNSLLGPRFNLGNMLDGMQNQDLMWKTRLFVHQSMGVQNYINFLLMQQELYPAQARHSMWSILGTHDTIRVFTDLFGSEDEMKNAVILQMTVLGVPMIYYGDEIGMHGGTDPNNRRPYTWETSEQNVNIHQFYKDIISLRRDQNALRLGAFEALDSSNDYILTYARFTEDINDETVIVAVNKYIYDYETTISLTNLPRGSRGNKFIDYISGKTYRVTSDNQIKVTVPSDGALILVGLLTDTPTIDGYFTALILASSLFGVSVILLIFRKNIVK